MIAKYFAQWVMNHRITCILLILVSSITLGLGAVNATFSANQRDFFKADDVYLHNLTQMEDEFSKDKSVLVSVEPKNNDIFSKNSLQAIHEITALGWQTPHSQRVE